MITSIITVRTKNDINGNSRKLYIVIDSDLTKNSCSVHQVKATSQGMRGDIQDQMGLDLAGLNYYPQELIINVAPKEFQRIVKEGAWR